MKLRLERIQEEDINIMDDNHPLMKCTDSDSDPSHHPPHAPAEPPPFHISSRGIAFGKFGTHVLWALFILALLVVLAWLAFFIGLCVLLAENNTPEVRSQCGGFWDFMLVSILSPVIIPAAYCILSCGIWSRWTIFSCAACSIMAFASLHMSLTASENRGCVAVLGTPPLLLYAGFIKAILYCCGAITQINQLFLRGPKVSRSNNDDSLC